VEAEQAVERDGDGHGRHGGLLNANGEFRAEPASVSTG
jgi:hypothetical protein